MKPKKKAAPSKVLLAADRERKEIVAALAEQVRRMRKLSRRLNAAARSATHFEDVNGERYTVEEWLAGALEEVVGKVGNCGLAEDVAFLRGYSTARIERDIVADLRTTARQAAERKAREIMERMTERLRQAVPSSTAGELAEALQDVRSMVEQLPPQLPQAPELTAELDKAQRTLDQVTRRRKSTAPSPAAPAIT